MKKIYALINYKGFFGSKWKANPYRSGLDKTLLKQYFNQFGWEIEFICLHEIDFKQKWENKIVIYTSSEENGLHYKGFIEDIVLGLDRARALVIPKFDFLRANNNKVYMEILRDQLLGTKLSGIFSRFYGTLEELQHELDEEKIAFPCVIKTAAGAMSRGVFLAKDKKELLKYAKKLSRTPHLFSEMKELLRAKKHNGYQKESKYQNKFIVQNFIPDLKNDWKVLVYGNHYYVLNRGIKDNDFRASGSHYNYKAGSKSDFNEELLNKVKEIYDILNVPHLSLDFAWDGSKSIIHEFQAIHFGTSTMDFSDDLYVFDNGSWNIEEAEFSQEEEYARGLVHYLERMKR